MTAEILNCQKECCRSDTDRRGLLVSAEDCFNNDLNLFSYKNAYIYRVGHRKEALNYIKKFFDNDEYFTPDLLGK